MKQKLLKSMLLLCALILGGASNLWATEEVYKTLTFCNAGTNSNKTQDYTSSWTETVSSFGWAISNFNNNNWGWNDGGSPALYVVKCGRKKGKSANTPSVATITTNAAIDQAITKVVVTLTAINSDDYNSIKLYMASTNAFDKDNDDYFETITVSSIPTSAGDMTITIPEEKRAANRFYKIGFDTKGSTSSNGHTGISKVEYYKAVAAPAYTITAQSNNNSYGTVSLDGSVITGSPKSGYRYATPAYTVTTGSATVAQDGNAFTVTPSSNCTVQINFEAIPTHTATFSVNGATSIQDFVEGAAVSFPSDPSSIAGKAFVGWTSSAIDGTTDEAPSFVNTVSEKMGNSDVTYYAVFAAAEVGDPVETKTQTLQYDTWTYSGTTTDKTSYRLFGNGSKIQSAAFNLSKLSKVIVYGGTFGGGSYNSLTIGDGTNIWKSVTVSGSSQTGENTYTEGTTLSGTKNLYITVTAGDGSNNGVRISKVEIFTNEPSVTYSAYCTSIIITAVETPEISPAGGVVASGTEVTITCSTDGANIYYTTDGTTPTSSSTAYNPVSKPTITVAQTIKVIAVKDGLEDSEVASASYTIAVPCAMPTFSLDEGEYVKGTTVTISTETVDATIYYTTNGDTPTTSSLVYSSDITINSAMTIKAIAVKDGMLNSEVASVSYTVIDYVTLPFSWAGGTSAELTSTTGVTASGLGSDYADSNAPYRVKMDNANDYIQIKTNAQPVKVLIGVKMIGGATTSKIKVQESADGSSFKDVEELTISGKQNDILNLKTSNPFAATTRYVKIIKSVHGSNIGVGPIMILDFEDIAVDLNVSGYATFASTYPLDFSDDSEFSAWQITGVSGSNITFEQITGTVKAGTGVLLKGTESATINIPVAASGTDISSINKLTGITTATAVVDNTYYGLSGNTFKKVNAGTVPAGKALLPASVISGADVKAFTFVFDGDDADGIKSLTPALSKGEGTVYDLSGRRVQKPTKGLYIVNGKKILF